MDVDRLKKIAGAVRTGGKGSVRRCAVTPHHRTRCPARDVLPFCSLHRQAEGCGWVMLRDSAHNARVAVHCLAAGVYGDYCIPIAL
jgi:hypothetical protein